MFAVFATQKCVGGRSSNIQIIIRFWKNCPPNQIFFADSLLTTYLALHHVPEPRYAVGVIEYNSFLVVNLRYRPLYSKMRTNDENSTKL